MDARAQIIASAYPLMAAYADEIVRVSDLLGIDPGWLANVINFESKGGDPKARNRISRATGLIQFMPCPTCTAEDLGTTIDALYEMTGRQQMYYVEKYLTKRAKSAPGGRLTSQEDVYMAVFYPAAIGKPGYTFSATVQAQNAGIATPSDYAAMANARARLPVDASTGLTEVGRMSPLAAERGLMVRGGTKGAGSGGISPLAISLIGSAAAVTITLAWVYRDRLRRPKTNPRRRRRRR